MDAEVEDEEASPKTVDGKKKESSRDKSEREYAQFLQRGHRTQGHTNPSIGSVHTVWKLLVMCRNVVMVICVRCFSIRCRRVGHGAEQTFLPITSTSQPANQSAGACLHCRQRKSRCDVSRSFKPKPVWTSDWSSCCMTRQSFSTSPRGTPVDSTDKL